MDRRVILAILLMMGVAVIPGLLMKPAPRPAPARAVADTARPAAPAPAPTMAAAAAPTVAAPTDTTATVVPQDTVLVTTARGTYGITTRGARLVLAQVPGYRSLAPGDAGAPVNLVADGRGLLGARLVTGRDTLPLADWDFQPSATELDARGGPQTLTLTGARGGVTVTLAWEFGSADYQYALRGTVTGLSTPGGTLLLDLGDGLRQTEHDSAQNHQVYSLVTKPVAGDAERHDFTALKPGEPLALEGQYEWVAVKSKYFVSALFAFDSTAGRFAGARLAPMSLQKPVTQARGTTAIPVAADGRFAFGGYAGPMEYQTLKTVGHDFDDVNPYGWPGFRGMIRFFSAPVRWMLVKLHALGVPWGVALVLFGIAIRLVLWPLNNKAMRSSMEMQAIQPLIQELQAKYKNDPQKLSQKQMELFKEHKVNPLGGCLPTLLPWPVMLALFFVFQNTIELRGAPFLWLPDLSLKDPYYIIPVLMGVSMWGMMKIGQVGMPPNDQTKMMTAIMPVMMTVMFATFASGLNLYYTVQNLVGIPQQWLLLQERKKRGLAKTPPPAPAPPAVKKK